MPKYKLNYIYIDQQNAKTFGVIRPSGSEAKDIEIVKQLLLSSKRSSLLLSIKTFEPSSIFYLNSMMVDSKFPQILTAALSIIQYHKKLSAVELCKLLSQIDPLQLNYDHEHFIYNHKWKQLLLALGSGMRTDAVWAGKFEGIEHHAIFKEIDQGPVPDFHWPTTFADYLFFNTMMLSTKNGGFEIRLA